MTLEKTSNIAKRSLDVQSLIRKVILTTLPWIPKINFSILFTAPVSQGKKVWFHSITGTEQRNTLHVSLLIRVTDCLTYLQKEKDIDLGQPKSVAHGPGCSESD